LFIAELGSVLLKKVRRGEMPPGAVLEALVATQLVVQLEASLPVAAAAFEIATRHQRSFYDSLYVALAIREGCQLVTADEKLVNGLGSAFRDSVVLLRDFGDSSV
jgi:predicted nucleic acid-binding protein